MERKTSKPAEKARLRKTYRLQEQTIKDIEKLAVKNVVSPAEIIEWMTRYFKEQAKDYFKKY